MTLLYRYFSKKIRLDISGGSSPKEMVHMTYQALFSGKINWSSVNFDT